MDVKETSKYYVVSFFPDAEEVEIDDRMDTVGWKAVLGEQDGQHIVMKVSYDKAKFPLDARDRATRGFPSDAKTILDDYAGRISECEVCKRLDANIGKIAKVSLLADKRVVEQETPLPQTQTYSAFDTGNPLQTIMAQMMFDTRLNQTGQVLTAAALEDEQLLARAMPTTISGLVELVANITNFTSGNGTLFRSPKQVTAYVKALREGAKAPINKEEEKKDESPVFRRASTVIVS